jgi:hypothetical protein
MAVRAWLVRGSEALTLVLFCPKQLQMQAASLSTKVLRAEIEVPIRNCI